MPQEPARCPCPLRLKENDPIENPLMPCTTRPAREKLRRLNCVHSGALACTASGEADTPARMMGAIMTERKYFGTDGVRAVAGTHPSRPAGS